jgi:hypothetical protein
MVARRNSNETHSSRQLLIPAVDGFFNFCRQKGSMNEPKFTVKPGVIYYPPKPEVIEKYAETVCEALEQKHGKGYLNTEVLHGFSEFLKVTATVYANHLTRKSREKKQ